MSDRTTTPALPGRGDRAYGTAHVGSMDTLLDALDLHHAIGRRIEQVETASAHADAIAAGIARPNPQYFDLLLLRLTEDRQFLSAYAQTIAERIAVLPYGDQAEQATAHLRPVTEAIERANLAHARVRHAREEART